MQASREFIETFLFVAVIHWNFFDAFVGIYQCGMKRFCAKICILESDSRNITPFSKSVIISTIHSHLLPRSQSVSFTNYQAYGVLRQEPLNFLERLKIELRDVGEAERKFDLGARR